MVAFNLLTSGSDLGLTIEPVGLLFAGQAGGPPPDPKRFRLSNPSTNPVAVTSNSLTVDGGNWLSYSPDQGVVGPGETISVGVRPNLEGLEPGTYRGLIQLFFSGRTRTVRIGLLVRERRASLTALSPRFQGNCAPTALIPELTSNSGGLPVSAGWPAFGRRLRAR